LDVRRSVFLLMLDFERRFPASVAAVYDRRAPITIH